MANKSKKFNKIVDSIRDILEEIIYEDIRPEYQGAINEWLNKDIESLFTDTNASKNDTEILSEDKLTNLNSKLLEIFNHLHPYISDHYRKKLKKQINRFAELIPGINKIKYQYVFEGKDLNSKKIINFIGNVNNRKNPIFKYNKLINDFIKDLPVNKQPSPVSTWFIVDINKNRITLFKHQLLSNINHIQKYLTPKRRQRFIDTINELLNEKQLGSIKIQYSHDIRKIIDNDTISLIISKNKYYYSILPESLLPKFLKPVTIELFNNIKRIIGTEKFNVWIEDINDTENAYRFIQDKINLIVKDEINKDNIIHPTDIDAMLNQNIKDLLKSAEAFTDAKKLKSFTIDFNGNELSTHHLVGISDRTRYKRNYKQTLKIIAKVLAFIAAIGVLAPLIVAMMIKAFPVFLIILAGGASFAYNYNLFNVNLKQAFIDLIYKFRFTDDLGHSTTDKIRNFIKALGFLLALSVGLTLASLAYSTVQLAFLAIGIVVAKVVLIGIVIATGFVITAMMFNSIRLLAETKTEAIKNHLKALFWPSSKLDTKRAKAAYALKLALVVVLLPIAIVVAVISAVAAVGVLKKPVIGFLGKTFGLVTWIVNWIPRFIFNSKNVTKFTTDVITNTDQTVTTIGDELNSPNNNNKPWHKRVRFIRRLKAFPKKTLWRWAKKLFHTVGLGLSGTATAALLSSSGGSHQVSHDLGIDSPEFIEAVAGSASFAVNQQALSSNLHKGDPIDGKRNNNNRTQDGSIDVNAANHDDPDHDDNDDNDSVDNAVNKNELVNHGSIKQAATYDMLYRNLGILPVRKGDHKGGDANSHNNESKEQHNEGNVNHDNHKNNQPLNSNSSDASLNQP